MKLSSAMFVMLVVAGIMGLAQASPTVDNDEGVTNLSVGVTQMRGLLATSDPADVYICWGTEDGDTTEGNWANTNRLMGLLAGSFSNTVSNLLYGLTYYYRCFASNTVDSSTAWAPATATFTTMQPTYVPVTAGLACWYDSSIGVTVDRYGVSTWDDISGNGHHASRASSGSPVLALNDVYSRPAVHIRGGQQWLDCAGTFFTKEQYVVVRSPNATWSGYGSFLGRKHPVGGAFLAGRPSSYNLSGRNDTGFWQDWIPQAVSKNGSAVPDDRANNIGFRLGTITDYMVIRIIVLDADPPVGNVSYQIGENDDLGSCDMDIAEIVAYNTTLSAADEDKVGYYLANKYGLNTVYPPSALHGAYLANMPAPLGASTSAMVSAKLTCSAGTVYDVRVYWNTVNGGTDASLWTNSAHVGTWTNALSTNISYTVTELLPGQSYYFTFRATNAADDLWPPHVLTFQTTAPVALDNDAGATNLAAGAAQLRGALTQGPADVTIYWGPTDGDTNKASWANTNSLTSLPIGPFSITVSPLIYGSTYYYRCYGSNGNGWAWAPATAMFTTLPPRSPVLSTISNLVCWFDATIGITTNARGEIQTWSDISGNAHHGVLIGGTPVLALNQINYAGPVAQFRGAYLSLDHPFFAKEQYVVVRSPRSTWSGAGAFLGRTSGRASNYIMASGDITFWTDQAPDAVSKNGISIPPEGLNNHAFVLAPIMDYMILKIVVNNRDTSEASYQIGRMDANSCEFDVAEILGYGVTNSASDAAAVGVYLATKYGLSTAGYPPLPPTRLTAVSPGSGAIILHWAASDLATGYNVKRSITSGSGYVTIGTMSATTCTDGTVVTGVMYYYVVSGTNDVGESANSAEISAHDKPQGVMMMIH